MMSPKMWSSSAHSSRRTANMHCRPTVRSPKPIANVFNTKRKALAIWTELLATRLSFLTIPQRTTDTDALELYNKKVRIANAKTGEVIGFNYFPPAVGMKKVQDGGKRFERVYGTTCAVVIHTYFIIYTPLNIFKAPLIVC